MALYGWQRKTAVTLPFIIAMLAVSLWSFTYSFELLSSDLDVMLFWVNVEYLGILAIPYSLFLFACRFTGRDQWLTPHTMAALMVIPLMNLLLVWTNPWHGLHYPTVDLIVKEGWVLLQTSTGPAYWTNVFYSYCLVVGSVLVMASALRGSLPPYRYQVMIILAGILIPLIGNIVYNFYLRQTNILDMTPISFALTGAVIVMGLFRYQFLELTPIARNKVVETMEDAWLVVDGSGRLVDFNLAAQSVFGLDKYTGVGRPVAQLLVEYKMWSPLAGPLDEQSEMSLALNGRLHFFDVRQTPLMGNQGEINGRLIILRDVSERKEAEMALQRLTNNLEVEVVERTADIQSEKEKIETILRTAKEGIALTDGQLRVQYANDEFWRLSPPDQAGDSRHMIVDLLFAQTGPGLQKQVTAVLSDRGVWQGEFSHQQADVAPVVCAVTAVPLHNSRGQLTGSVWTVHDISQQRHLDRARNQFITNISHEFRTPLANLKLYTTLIESQALSAKAKEYTAVFQAQIARLETLTQRILTIASLQSDLHLVDRRLVDLRTILHPLLAQYQEIARLKKIQFAGPALERPLPWVMGNPVYLHQALVELVENAFTFTPPGGEVTICVTTCDDGRQSWVCLRVSDTGLGILPEEQPKIYDRFFRGSLAASGQKPGAGLGLSIVWEIVKLHQGVVECDSVPGKGSQFTIRLPAAPESPAAAK